MTAGQRAVLVRQRVLLARLLLLGHRRPASAEYEHVPADPGRR